MMLKKGRLDMRVIQITNGSVSNDMWMISRGASRRWYIVTRDTRTIIDWIDHQYLVRRLNQGGRGYPTLAAAEAKLTDWLSQKDEHTYAVAARDARETRKA